MSQSELTNLLHDPRLAPHAVSALPVWLWSVDGTRVLWANAVAAAIFGARSPAALSQQTFDASNTAATQMARVGATLSDGGAVRLERLRGFGAGFGRALTCQCSRLALADATGAVLVAAAERAGPDLSLDERARRLLDGIDTPFAVFAEDGRLIHATPAALERIGVATDLIALGAEALGTQARESGEAQDDVSAGHLSVRRLGSGTATVLLARVEAAATTQAPALEAPAAEAAPASELQPETKASAPAPETAPPVVPEPAIVTQAERKHPLRFVWQMDEAGAFTIASDEFVQLIGPKTAAMLGHPWSKISAALDIDTDGAIAKALSSRDTWSGIVLPWPVDGSDERLPIELSGLPVFDRDRSFRGYRGFGVCRDTERLSALAIARSLAPPEPLAPEPPAMPSKPTPAPDDFATTDLPAEPTLPLAENVVPFRPPVVAEKPAAKEHQNGEAAPALTPIESTAFSEIGRRLTDRLQAGPHTVSNRGPEPLEAEQQPAARTRGEIRPETERAVLDRLPVGVLVYRLNDLLYANRAFLDWTGYDTLAALTDAGGLDSLFIEPSAGSGSVASKSLTISTQHGEAMPVEGRLLSVTWAGENALALMLYIAAPAAHPPVAAAAVAPQKSTDDAVELRAILDTASDSVLVLDGNGRIISANRSAETLFGYEGAALIALPFDELLAPQSQIAALEELQRVIGSDAAAMLNQGSEVMGRVREGGFIPLFMTLGRIGISGDKVCAIFRDMSAWKKTEKELHKAKREADKAIAGKTELLAKISHEIRTPLNAIIGFAQVMMDERFGPIGNERYRDYLRDIHESGTQVVSLMNDFADLSKIDAGKLELSFANINLNYVVSQGVAAIQADANRERIIMRLALSPNLPQVLADARAVRQIVLNLLSNSIRLAGTGGQVIISTALTDAGDAVLRVRDTGAGMSEQDLQTALEPFRQLPTSGRWGSGGTGLGLPLTKALAEANHASFRIKSEIEHGTLVEIAFPPARVVAK